jgi:nitroreductase
LLDHIFSIAQQSPSNCNAQPWLVKVISGLTADRMRKALTAAVESGRSPAPDFPLTGPYPGVYRERQVGAAVALFNATGVRRDDKQARHQSMLRNFQFFDAPHAAFIFLPAWAGYREAADCGIYLQSLMLGFAANGIASCAQGALSHHADVVRQVLGNTDDMRLLVGLAFGYADPSHQANFAVTSRAAVDEVVTFHD